MEKTNPAIPEAKVAAKKRGRFSFVWIVPIVAALVGAWVGINHYNSQGPTITIVFKSAEGLEENKTVISYNGVEIGKISTIRLSADYQTVVATAKMSPQTEAFLHKDTQFWVVKPQISGANVSGLSTIISGAYIGMEIGQSKEKERHFTALADAPLETGGVHGRFFTLRTPELGSLGRGAPIYFRRLQAGQVASYELDPGGKFLNVKIFVQSPYDQFVTADTKFWQASGVDLSLTASGMQLRTESLLSILVGGIAFESPAADGPVSPAAENAVFTLNKSREEAFRPAAFNPQTYVLVFKESLRGLAAGAPVEMEGITIGEVTKVNAQFDSKTFEFSAPVTVVIDPTRYGLDMLNAPSNTSPEAARAFQHAAVESLVAHGLRAQLKTGSLISGAQYVALDFFPDAQPVTVDWSQTPAQLPTIPGQMENLEAKASSIFKKIDQMPFGEIGTNLNQTLVGARGALAGVQGTLTNTDRLLMSANRFIAPDSVLDVQLNAMLQQLGGAANAMRVLADYLERHPEAIIRGKPADDKQP